MCNAPVEAPITVANRNDLTEHRYLPGEVGRELRQRQRTHYPLRSFLLA